MNKPKIALLIDWYLPGTKAGGPVRSVYSLVSLLKNYFDFYIITTNADLGKKETYKEVEANKLMEKEDIHYYYFSADKLNEKNILDLFDQINPNLIYLNSFWSFNFSIRIVRLKHKGVIKAPVLLAPRGMLGKGALGLKSFKKRIFLSLAKLTGLYSSIVFHATQNQEERDIRSKFKSSKIIVAPNINSGSIINTTRAKQSNSLKLFFLSRIAEVKNLHFALEILKSVPENFKIEYDIFGNLEDIEYWNTCKTIIDSLPKNISVTYKTELSFNEVQQTVSKYHCLLLPTLNENFGHSIVESLLSGCPVIISDQTPWNDLEKHKAGYAISLDNKQKFIEAVTNYAKQDQTQFSESSEQAIKYISSRIDLEKIKDQYKILFNDSIKN